MISGVWPFSEAASPAPLILEPLNVDCRSSEPLVMTQPKAPILQLGKLRPKGEE